jgi:uncharacterized protein YijF (DUF1287 family)
MPSAKKKFLIIIGLLLCVLLVFMFFYRNFFFPAQIYLGVNPKGIFYEKKIDVPAIEIDHDEDSDGVKDLADLVKGARADVKNKSNYKSAYYSGGYPPDNEGVCTDLLWRAFKEAGYDLKKLVDTDIKKYTAKYPRINGKPDSNIDFRRVSNVDVFLKRHAQVLTMKIEPGNVENLKEWQAGDIVTFGAPVYHTGIVSDLRRPDGVPYLIHNAGPSPREEDALLYWHENISPIIGHYRWPKI